MRKKGLAWGVLLALALFVGAAGCAVEEEPAVPEPGFDIPEPETEPEPEADAWDMEM